MYYDSYFVVLIISLVGYVLGYVDEYRPKDNPVFCWWFVK